jgi:hypothetical protein
MGVASPEMTPRELTAPGESKIVLIEALCFDHGT